MRVCPRCQGRYDDETRFCPRDGASLPEAAVDPRIGQVLLGQFELREVCGRGAMGTVYRALQRGMDREVAVKILRTDTVRDPGIVKRFLREARSVARLSHPNIVQVFLVGDTEDGVPFMVMELIHGEPLSAPIARGERFAPGRALRLARQVASALAEAHGAGVIHRDLKPANILIEQRRRAADLVKVVDFGIAKIVGEAGGPAPGESALTRTGTILFGTPHYLSPEQGQGVVVDGRSDLYSLGVMLFAMLCGRVPFDGTGMAVVLQHVNQPPPRPRDLAPELPGPVEQLVLALLAKDPAARPQTAEELAGRIDALLAQLGETAPRFDSSPPPAPTVAPAAAARLGSTPMAAGSAPANGSASAASPPALTIKATALPPPGPMALTPPAMTVRGNALNGAHLVSGAPPAVTIKATALPPGGVAPTLPAALALLGVAPADVTAPPRSAQASAVPMPVPAETSYGLPPVAARAPGGPLAVPASAIRASSVIGAVPVSINDGRAEQTAPVSLDGSVAWRPPSTWRRVGVPVVILLLAGGGAAAAVWALGRRDGSEGIARAAPAPAGASPGPAPIVTPPAPVVADAGPTGAFDPIASGALAAARVVSLGEAGYAVRVLLPEQVDPGVDVPVAIEIWEPSGKPASCAEVRLAFEDPSGAERVVTAAVTAQAGRFALSRRFAAAGAHRVRIFPAEGKSKPVVWFDLAVGGAALTPAPGDDAIDHRDQHPGKKKSGPRSGGKTKAGAGGKVGSTGLGGDGELGDPYKLLDEASAPPPPPPPLHLPPPPADPGVTKTNDKPPAPPRDPPKGGGSDDLE